MAIGYLISPVIQVEDINGKPLVGGRIRVYRHGTTIPYITYKDFNGDMNPAEVILDNKGMCVLLADVDGLYDVYCEDRNHVEQWSRLNVGAGQGGGGSSTGIDSIVSSDNSLVIIRTGSSVDITINRDGEASALEAYSGVIASNGNFQFTADPINSVGDDLYLDNGQILCKKKWYHYDATVVLTWNGAPVNQEQDVVITGPDISDRVRFDLSVPHVETVDISGVCEITQDDSPITFAIQSLPSGMTAQITNASIHAIEMGAGGGHTYRPGTGIVIEGDTISVDQTTVAMQSDLPDMSGYQEKLTTGDGISIDQNDEISVKTDGTTITVNANGELVATGGSFTQVQADYAQQNNQAVDYIKNKPDLSVFAQTADLATVATSGDYNDLTNTPSIPAAQVNSDWNAASGVSQILNKPSLAAVATSGAYSDLTGTPTINNVPAVTSTDDDKVLKASYSGGTGSYSWENDTSDVPSYTTSDDGKVLGVVDNQGTAELQWITGGSGTQVQSDWTENNSSDPAYIKHRPVEQLLSAGSGISIAESSGTVVISSNVSMSSLNTAGITDIQVVQSLPASPTATVLYLIEET